jgi:hypothetical protein
MPREPRSKRAGFGPGDVRNSQAAAIIAAVEAPAALYTHDTTTNAPVPGRSQPHPGPACATTGAQSRGGKRFASDD